MTIVTYNPQHFEEILHINDACFTGTQRPSSDRLKMMLSVSDCYIAKEDDQIIGFAIVDLTTNQQAYLWHMAVSPDYQNRGVGGNLLRHLTLDLRSRGFKKVSLHANANHPAQKLYFDYEFRVTDIERGYFQNGTEDGLVMERVL